MKLAIDVALEQHRPPLPQEWNPALKYLITTAWVNDPQHRPALWLVASQLSMILQDG